MWEQQTTVHIVGYHPARLACGCRVMLPATLEWRRGDTVRCTKHGRRMLASVGPLQYEAGETEVVREALFEGVRSPSLRKFPTPSHNSPQTLIEYMLMHLDSSLLIARIRSAYVRAYEYIRADYR